MKVLLLAVFIAAVTAIPTPDEDAGAVEMIVNGLAEGQALEIGNIVDIKLNEHADGQMVATNLLHPYTAVGIAEAAAAAAAVAEADQLPLPVAPEVVLPQPAAPEVLPAPVALPQPVAPEVVLPEPVVLPQPAVPEVLPEPVVLPQPVAPEVALPKPVILPQPVAPEVILPEAVILPEPVAPEVVVSENIHLPKPVAPEVVMPAPAVPVIATQDGEVYNDGVVSVTVNASEDAGVFSTLQSWFNLVLNYFNEDGAQTTQQIV